MTRLFFMALCFAAIPVYAYAQNTRTIPAQTAVTSSDKPVEITADETLEWHQNDQQYIARKNVIVKQGEVTIKSNLLTADYVESEESDFDITLLTAQDNVTIQSRGNVVTGDKAIYDTKTAIATITGDNLTLTSPGETLTARDNFKYFSDIGKLEANGDVKITRGTDTLETPKAEAFFTEDADGKRALEKMNALGSVRITTPTEVLTGNRGTYDAKSNTAIIFGEVKITRGPNILEGDRAKVNLTTNVSSMIGNPNVGNRVRGVFYPGSEGNPSTPDLPHNTGSNP